MSKIQEIFIGCILTLIGIFIFTSTLSLGAKESVFPRLLAIAIGLCGLVNIINSFIIKNYMKNNKMPLKINYKIFMVYIFTVLYVISISYIGYFTSTTIFLLILMPYLGLQNKSKIILAIAVILSGILIGFVFQFKVPLPKGLLL